MKVAFLMNWFDSTHITRYPNGIGYYICNALKNNGVDVEIIPPAPTGHFPYKVKQVLYKYFTNKKYFRFAEPKLIKKEAKIRSEILKNSNADFIFSFGPLPSVFLETNKKIAFWADACFAELRNYNPAYTNLAESTQKYLSMIEQTGLNKADIVFYPSEWARETAIYHYNLIPDKIKIAPFGANMHITHNNELIENLIEKRINSDICRLLIIGASWKYKGVDIAIAVTKRLNERGIKSELTIIGCANEAVELPDFIKNIRFLDKSSQSELETFLGYYYNATFYLMPTLTECFAHVLIEANAFGLPAITHKTGGLASLIKDDINGKLFDIGVNIDDYCDYIIENFNDKEKYRQFCLSSFNEYKTRLNWDNGAKIIIEAMKNSLNSNHH